MNKIFLSIFICFFTAVKALSCSCPTSISIDSAFEDSEIIFQGKVFEIFKDKFYSYQGGTTNIVNFEVTKNFKKTKVGEGTITLVDYKSSCDITFEQGKEYIVFAYDIGGGHYYTSICAPTSLVDKFEPAKLQQLEEVASKYEISLSNHVTAFVIDKTSWDQLNSDLDQEQLRVRELERTSRIWMIVTSVLTLALITTLVWKRRSADNRR